MNIGIIGCGNIGVYLASKLSTTYDVYVYSKSVKDISTVASICDGKVKYQGTIKHISDNISVLNNCEVLIITYPPHLIPDLMTKLDVKDKLVILVQMYGGVENFFNTATTQIIGLLRVPGIVRKISDSVAQLFDERQTLLFSGFNIDKSYVKLVEEIFLIPAIYLANYLEVALISSNAIVHPARIYALFKSGTACPKELFYADWNNLASDILLKLDGEHQELVNKLNLLYIPSLKQYYNISTPQQLTDKMRSIKTLSTMSSPVNSDGTPDLTSRYFVSDFEFGLTNLNTWCCKYGVKCPTMDMLLDWYRELNDKQIKTKI